MFLNFIKLHNYTVNAMRYVTNIIINCIFLVAVISIVGYILNQPYLYTWGSTPMALNTSFSFVLVSICLWIMNNKQIIFRSL